MVSKIGYGLILFSGVLFFVMISVPWMDLSTSNQVLVGTSLFVSVQVSWWIGAFMVGPEAIKKFTAWFKGQSSA